MSTAGQHQPARAGYGKVILDRCTPGLFIRASRGFVDSRVKLTDHSTDTVEQEEKGACRRWKSLCSGVAFSRPSARWPRLVHVPRSVEPRRRSKGSNGPA